MIMMMARTKWKSSSTNYLQNWTPQLQYLGIFQFQFQYVVYLDTTDRIKAAYVYVYTFNIFFHHIQNILKVIWLLNLCLFSNSLNKNLKKGCY